jgi:hypothetical protein
MSAFALEASLPDFLEEQAVCHCDGYEIQIIFRLLGPACLIYGQSLPRDYASRLTTFCKTRIFRLK